MQLAMLARTFSKISGGLCTKSFWVACESIVQTKIAKRGYCYGVGSSIVSLTRAFESVRERRKHCSAFSNQ
jgi:hypothetical protein